MHGEKTISLASWAHLSHMRDPELIRDLLSTLVSQFHHHRLEFPRLGNLPHNLIPGKVRKDGYVTSSLPAKRE